MLSSACLADLCVVTGTSTVNIRGRKSCCVLGKDSCCTKTAAFAETLGGGGSNKEATAKPDGSESARKPAGEVEEAGVACMLGTFDPERKEEIWTVTRRISWVKGKEV